MKDRVILAIYIAAKVGKRELEELDLIQAFRGELEGNEKLESEFQTYACLDDRSEKKEAVKIHTSLELNLMLAFLYLSGLLCKLPVLESDILYGAQTNRFGYLTEYKRTA